MSVRSEEEQGQCAVTWQQLYAHKHPMTTLFELKFNEGYVYLSPLLL